MQSSGLLQKFSYCYILTVKDKDIEDIDNLKA